jgi:DNA repair ATPase RecN
MRNCLILLFVVTLISCDKQIKLGLREQATAQADGYARFAGGEQSETSPVTVERKLIKNGSVEFEVSDVESTKKSITQLTNDSGGYISTDNQNNYSGSPHYDQTVRIPSEKLDEFISKIEGLARNVDAKNISVQDVTEEFIDVETRLKTKKGLETRYLELLKQAKTVKDLIEVETQLANVRGEIESMEGRLKYLTSQVSFSTVTLSYYTRVSGNYGFGYRFMSSFGEGWDAFLDFIVGLFAAWPFLIIAGVGTWLGRRWWRRRKLKTTVE